MGWPPNISTVIEAGGPDMMFLEKKRTLAFASCAGGFGILYVARSCDGEKPAGSLKVPAGLPEETKPEHKEGGLRL